MMKPQEAVHVGTGCFSVLLGYVVLGVVLKGNHWHEAECLEEEEKGRGHVSVVIGLAQVLVTLSGRVEQHGSRTDTSFHNSFSWEDGYMKDHLKMALQKGHPDPVLTVLEYLSEDYPWSVHYAFAGRLVTVLLCSSFVSVMAVILLAYLKHKRETAVVLGTTGLLLVTSTALYDLCLPRRPLLIRLSSCALEFMHGWCYYITLYSGLLSLALGCLALCISRKVPAPVDPLWQPIPVLYCKQQSGHHKHFSSNGS